ncbi:MAG: protein YgfX [Methylococcaceae bacterium]
MTARIAPLSVTVKPSKRLNQLLLLLYGLAAIASVLNTLPLLTQFFLLCFLWLQYQLSYQHLAKQSLTLCYSQNVGWQFLENNEFIAIEILKSSVITSVALFLHFKKRDLPTHPFKKLFAVWQNPDKTIVIVYDALNAEDYRKLIVWLKITANA